MALIKDDKIKALDTTIKLNFNEGLKMPVDETYKRFTMDIPSDSSSNTYEWLSELPYKKSKSYQRSLTLF